MTDSVKWFLKLWDKFEELTQSKYRNIFWKSSENMSIYDMIEKLSNISWTIYQKQYSFIDYCRKKRNLIRHWKFEEEYNIYMDDFIESFNYVVEKAKPISVHKKAIKPVKQYDISKTISKVLNDMSKNNFTHIPITENWKLVGILSETSLVQYLAEHKEVLLDQSDAFINHRDLIDLKYSSDNVKFVAKDDDYDLVINKFIEEYKKGQKLSCVLVTQNWKPYEWILWILTTWDIIWRDD